MVLFQTQMTQKAPGRRRLNTSGITGEMRLSVVHLGTTLKAENHDVDDVWSYSAEQGSGGHREIRKSSKSPYKNMYELSRKNKNDIPLNKGYWKIPGLSSNLLGDYSKDFLSKKHLKGKGIYEAKFRKWYSTLEQEKSLILPPIKTTTLAHDSVFDPSKLEEKNYISQHLSSSSPLKRFARDQVHLPRIYSNCLGCRDCRRTYTNEIFIENYLTRNNILPMCGKSPDEPGNISGIHHCDVLGERYCKNCIEKRNRRFSQQLEDSVVGSDMKYTHYSGT